MRKRSSKGPDEIERYSTGFFQSLTPTSYVLFGLILVGAFVTGWFVFQTDDTTPMKASISAGGSHLSEPDIGAGHEESGSCAKG